MSISTVRETAPLYGKMDSPLPSTGQRVRLHGVSWGTYEALLNDLGDRQRCRLTYDNGELEFMAPCLEHEGSNRPFENLIFILADEYELEYKTAGSLTCLRKDLKKGIEPDSCFYIRNAHRIGHQRQLDLRKDPPPDLMIEIDISSDSMNKLPICEALQVPEHWQYNGEKLEIRVLRKGRYVISVESGAFPGLKLAPVLPQFIKMGMNDGILKMTREFRKWIRKNKPKKT